MTDFPREFIDIDPADPDLAYRYAILDSSGNETGQYIYLKYAPGALNSTPTALNRAWMQPIEEELGTNIPARFAETVFGFNPRAHSQTITSSRTWTVPSGVTKVDVWLVGGGAGGGTNNGGGGGHCLMQKDISVTPGSGIAVTIGAGGAAGNAGGTTSFGAYSAAGGSANGDGGSGGGGMGGTNSNGAGNGGSGGADGGNGSSYSTNSGGIGGKGDGLLSTINPYTGVLYAGGGGGTGGAVSGKGGAGGGGDAGANGTANTGGGGGAGASGGSGICIIYWD